MPPTASSSPTVHQIRRRWKPTKDRLLAEGHEDHPLSARIHRACSWLARAEELTGDEGQADADAALLFRWIALNALYGRWNAVEGHPEPDATTLRAFLDAVVELDTDGVVGTALVEHRRLVMAILEDEWVSSFFWEDPTDAQARRSRKAMYDARTWYATGRHRMTLGRTLERVYLVRCQLAHGAATHGGRLNRSAVRRGGTLLGHLVPTFLVVLADHGLAHDWGGLCYPPLSGS